MRVYNSNNHLFSFTFVVLFSFSSLVAVPLERVSVSAGRTAELPCDISPPPLDSLYLVLWYKNDSDFPIYKSVPKQLMIDY